jgi:hypothetical protein
MVSKRYSIFGSGFKKNKNNVVLFHMEGADIKSLTETVQSLQEQNIYINYLLEDQYKSLLAMGLNLKRSKQNTVLSHINEEFLNVPGKKYTEFRETRNKFDKIVSVKTEPNSINDIMELIDLWDKNRGTKYGWQKHSGYDRNFFEKFWQEEKNDLFSYFFYIGEKLVGYSIVSKLGNESNPLRSFNYVIRKNDTTLRNLCLYIDFKTFFLMYKELKKEFIINWGVTSKYKKKFPIYEEVPTYFCKVIK